MIFSFVCRFRSFFGCLPSIFLLPSLLLSLHLFFTVALVRSTRTHSRTRTRTHFNFVSFFLTNQPIHSNSMQEIPVEIETSINFTENRSNFSKWLNFKAFLLCIRIIVMYIRLSMAYNRIMDTVDCILSCIFQFARKIALSS